MGRTVSSQPKLLIFLDHPNAESDKRGKGGYSQADILLMWLMDRMTISPKDWRVEYTLRCYKGDEGNTKAMRLHFIQQCSIHRFATLQLLKLKAVVSLGTISCEAFLGGNQLKFAEGAEWQAMEPALKDLIVFAGYSPAYCLESPSELPRLFRLLWKASEFVGLKPKLNMNLKHPNIEWKTKK